MKSRCNLIYIVDDDEDFRDSLQWLLEADQYNVIGFASAREFLDKFDGTMGCMLLDVRMPDINGLALQRMMGEQNIQLPIVVISGHGDIPMAVNAMKNGALDFIEKPFDDEGLLRLVQHALLKADQIIELNEQLQETKEHYESLSRREKEVMALVVQGLANREIAEKLGISPKTVEVHRARVMSKMSADSLPALVHQFNKLQTLIID